MSIYVVLSVPKKHPVTALQFMHVAYPSNLSMAIYAGLSPPSKSVFSFLIKKAKIVITLLFLPTCIFILSYHVQSRK